LLAIRTAGGHRRIALAEAVRFIRHTGARVVRPDLILGAATAAPVAPFDAAGPGLGHELFALFQQDDAAAARALILALYVSGWPLAAICDGPMRVALEIVGALWEHGPEGIVVEHRATDTCLRTLAEIRTLLPGPVTGAPTVLGAAPSGDTYLVPSMMCAAVLAELGYADHNLGPEVPFSALDRAIDHYRPRLVWLAMSVTRRDESLAPMLIDFARRLADQGATLIIGGRGVPRLKPAPGLLHLHSMAELAAFARGAQTG
jgi:MerR family transcriptional regulator, light-induced transcriptional regulator